MDAMVVVSGEGDVTPLNVELMVDRLRFMGLDPELVDEAEERLRGDVGTGMEWPGRQLQRLEPPRKPPTCDCGEPLVSLEWRGRATVRCSVCGSRWGVEVVGEQRESLWNIGGPDDGWRAAHPVQYDDPYGFEPEEVLRDGVPPLPAGGIDPGTWYPLATWQDEDHAAVLYVHRRAPDEFDLPGDEYESEIEHLVLDDGEWTTTGGGGGNWVDVFEPPVDLLEEYVVLGTGTTGSDDGSEAVSFTRRPVQPTGCHGRDRRQAGQPDLSDRYRSALLSRRCAGAG